MTRCHSGAWNVKWIYNAEKMKWRAIATHKYTHKYTCIWCWSDLYHLESCPFRTRRPTAKTHSAHFNRSSTLWKRRNSTRKAKLRTSWRKPKVKREVVMSIYIFPCFSDDLSDAHRKLAELEVCLWMITVDAIRYISSKTNDIMLCELLLIIFASICAKLTRIENSL